MEEQQGTAYVYGWVNGWMDGWTNGRNGLILWSWGERLDRVGQVGEALHTHLFFIIINIVIIIILFSFIPLNFVWMDGGKGLTLSTFSYDISSRYGPTYAGVKGVCVHGDPKKSRVSCGPCWVRGIGRWKGKGGKGG